MVCVNVLFLSMMGLFYLTPLTPLQKTIDNRKARSDATKNALMRATEKLVAERGVENISIKEIVAEAGQKNESALQYHFQNLTGLLRAIHDERSEQVHQKRAELLADVLKNSNPLKLRDICLLMVRPTFELARSNVEFRRYVKAFGHELALSEPSPLKMAVRSGGGGESGAQMGELLKAALPHLNEEAYHRRLEAAVMLCSASMYHQARQKSAFRGRQSELFLHNLVDALCGLLGAEVSQETKNLS